MRTVEDQPVLTSAFLNCAVSAVFRPEETVELVPGELTNDEVFELWQALRNSLQLSVAYVARVVRIESETRVPQAGPVRVRELEFVAGPGA